MAAMILHPTEAPHSALRWDVFCRVIDNFGDIGVCWRLCADLAHRGHRVRLWVDDTSALQWMAPGALEQCVPGLTVHAWSDSTDAKTLAELTKQPPADVWVEGFGCEIAPEFIAAYAYSTRDSGLKHVKIPVWINFEYLSAESYVERVHGLPSPVMSGPGKGWTKYFYYPGFTPRAGGLLREADLTARQRSFDRDAWLRSIGITPQPQERLVSLFCYEPPALELLLGQLVALPGSTRLLVTPGRAQAALNQAIENRMRLHPSWNLRSSLSFLSLPLLTQPDFDHLLWACDLNCVRGEDSLVRALWAGKPMLWQIYPQSDTAHHDKLEALLDMLDANATQRRWHRLWNGVEMPHPDDALLPSDLANWQQTARGARARLMDLPDLTHALVDFVLKKR